MNVTHQSQTMARSPKNSSSGARELTPNVLLRDARKQNHWTQKQLADKVGVTALTVSRWERGETVPDTYARLKLCRVLRRIPEQLWSEDSKDTNVLEETLPSGSIQADSHSTAIPSTSEEVAEKDHLPWYTILRRERDRRGWSQSQLAEQIGTASKTVSRWERGLTFPQSWYRQRLMAIFGLSAEELGFLTVISSSAVWTSARNLPVPCGDCDRPEITATLDTIVINQSANQTTFYFRLANGTREDAGLRFESVSLTDPHGDFFLGRSVGSFLLAAGQSIPLSLVFDWVPEQNTLYSLNIVLIRPNKWRNTYQPIPLTFNNH